MKVYLSVDMEGLAGVSDPKPTNREDTGYGGAVDLMIGEANAAIEGAFSGGAESVTVNDSHGAMFNLSPERLDRRARLVQGGKPYSMVEAARGASCDLALFVGYHARAGHPRGVIAHTYSGLPTLTTLAGRPTGEYGINALYLGTLGVPVALVSGDDALAEEVREWLPWATPVVVKQALSWRAADSLHPAAARELVRDATREVVSRATSDHAAFRPLSVDPPIELGVEFAHAGEADYVAVMPGFERSGDRGVTYQARDGIEAYRAFLCAVRLARIAAE